VVVAGGPYEHLGTDIIAMVKEETIGIEGMRIDRMFFERFEDTVRENETIAAAVESGQWDRVIDYVNHEVFDKPEAYYSLDKLRKAAAKAYVTNGQVRDIIENRHFTDLATNPAFSTRDFKAVPRRYRELIPAYVKDYVPLNQFM